MTTAAMRKRLERLEATAPPAGAMTVDEKAAAIVEVLVADLGLRRLPPPAEAVPLAVRIPPPSGVEFDAWWRALEAALSAAHRQ